MVRRRLRTVLVSLVVLLVGGIGLLVLLTRHSLPQLAGGAAADEQAHAVERAVHKEAWDRTQAIRWTFLGAHEHLWDRTRGLSRVKWGHIEALVDLGKNDGRAYEGGKEVTGPRRVELVKKAYAFWINDSFWLNPMAKLFDGGVTRYAGQVDGEPALLIRYASGGLTPGDSYLYLLDSDGLPRAWRMWVSIIPIGGIESSFAGYVTLSTGAKIATHHKMVVPDIALTDVAGAATLAELVPGADPFARLMQ